MARVFISITGLLLVASTGAVRSQQDLFSDGGSKGSCTDALSNAIAGSTYQYFLGPMLEGKYYIKSSKSGQYLIMGDKGAHVVSKNDKWYKNNRDKIWKVARNASAVYPELGYMPVFTIRHRSTKKYLGSGGENWQLERAADGIHWLIKNSQVDKDGVVSTTYLQEGSSSSTTMSASPDVNGTLWMMEYSPTLMQRSPLNLFQAKYSDQSQLDQALVYPMWVGSNTTWAALCNSGAIGMYDTCLLLWQAERDFFKAIGHMKIDSMQVSVRLDVKGLCYAPTATVANMFHKVPVVEALTQYAGEVCSGLDVEDVSLSVQEATVAYCYEDCMLAMEKKSDEYLWCHKMQEVNQTKFYEDIVTENEQCAGLPFTHLEDLMEFKLKKKCWTFAPPSPVWLTNDQSVGDVNEACTADKSWTRSAGLVDGKRCPAGTMCQCPGPNFYPKPTAEIRRNHGSSFVTDGDAGIVSVTNYLVGLSNQMGTPTFVMEAGTILWNGGAVTTAIATANAATMKALWAIPMYQFQVYYNLLKHAFSVATWRCTHTIACWPVAPRKVRKTSAGSTGACRAKDKVKDLNGGATWMMPPPGTKYAKGLLGCKLDSCTREESRFQKIGFGNNAGFNSPSGQVEVYNCQPLAWEEMSPDQRVKYLTILFNTGVDKEYDLKSVLEDAKRARDLSQG